MKGWLSTAALSVALTMSIAIPSAGALAMGGKGGAPAGVHGTAGFGGRGFGFRHGFGFHRRFLPGTEPFHQRQFDFGSGFRSHAPRVMTGGIGDYDYAYDDDDGPYADDDIENLHFRAQEPFGPGDIGRPPVRAEPEPPYILDPAAPGFGDDPGN